MGTSGHKGLIWDFPLYAANMFYYHFLIKKLLWPMVGQNIAMLEGIYGESRRSQRDAMMLLKEKDAGTLPGKPQPRGDAQMNRNGLI